MEGGLFTHHTKTTPVMPPNQISEMDWNEAGCSYSYEDVIIHPTIPDVNEVIINEADQTSLISGFPVQGLTTNQADQASFISGFPNQNLISNQADYTSFISGFPTHDFIANQPGHTSFITGFPGQDLITNQADHTSFISGLAANEGVPDRTDQTSFIPGFPVHEMIQNQANFIKSDFPIHGMMINQTGQTPYLSSFPVHGFITNQANFPFQDMLINQTTANNMYAFPASINPYSFVSDASIPASEALGNLYSPVSDVPASSLLNNPYSPITEASDIQDNPYSPISDVVPVTEDPEPINQIRYFDEVYFIMRAYGDLLQPSQKTVNLLHNLMESQMALLIKNCENIMKIRKARDISHEDVLFLMRRNKVMLKRLLQFLYIQDRGEFVLPGFEEYLGHAILPKDAERLNHCVQFLSTIEKFAGDLQLLFNDKRVKDHIFNKRIQRRDLIARSEIIDENLKEDFEHMLNVSLLSYTYGMEEFKTWLKYCSGSIYDITPLALTIIEFLAIETVAGLVEKALFMRSRKCKGKEIKFEPPLKLRHPNILFGNLGEDDEQEGKRIRNPESYLKFMRSPFSSSLSYVEDLDSRFSSSDFIQRLGNPPIFIPIEEMEETIFEDDDEEEELVSEKSLTTHEIQIAFIHYQRPKPMTMLLKTNLPYLEKRKVHLICLAFPEEEFNKL